MGPNISDPRVRFMAQVLIVDDEPAVLKMVQSVLENAGFAVVAAGNGAEALALLENHDIDVLVTDVMMPGMSGPDLVKEARRLYPSLPVCCMTGYVVDRDLSIPRGTPLIMKPFRSQELVDAVQRAIVQRTIGPPVQAVPPASPAELQKNVFKARDEWLASIDRMSEIISGIPSGIPNPDGSARIKLAGRNRSAAFARYEKAFEEYRRALKEQGSPERGKAPGSD